MRVHIERSSPRARYVIRHILDRMLGFQVDLVESDEDLRAGEGPRLKYGGRAMEEALYIPDSGGLLLDRVPAVIERGQGPHLFEVDGEHDVFASVFYLLSLADEERCAERDEHGRVRSEALFTVRNGLADAPYVDRWALALASRIHMRWPGTTCRQRTYRHLATVDMDNVLRFAGRPLSRAVGATLKDLLRGAFGATIDRWLVRAAMREDPYLQAVRVVADQQPLLDRALFFYLVKGNGVHDHAASVDHEGYRKSLVSASSCGSLGLHPSYGTSVATGAIAEERDRLSGIAGFPVRATRQHFLRWRLPQTLRELEALGFTEDHTLGFSDRVGFRASTCTPFLWYDLQQERESALMLHPFAAMDSALIEQMHLAPAAVVDRMCVLGDLVRAVSGEFVTVWHDRYLSGYGEFAPWPSVFEQVVQHAKA